MKWIALLLAVVSLGASGGCCCRWFQPTTYGAAYAAPVYSAPAYTAPAAPVATAAPICCQPCIPCCPQ